MRVQGGEGPPPAALDPPAQQAGCWLAQSFPRSSRTAASWVWRLQPAAGTCPDFPAEPEQAPGADKHLSLQTNQPCGERSLAGVTVPTELLRSTAKSAGGGAEVSGRRGQVCGRRGRSLREAGPRAPGGRREGPPAGRRSSARPPWCPTQEVGRPRRFRKANGKGSSRGHGCGGSSCRLSRHLRGRCL